MQVQNKIAFESRQTQFGSRPLMLTQTKSILPRDQLLITSPPHTEADLSLQAPQVQSYLKSFPQFGHPPFNADFHGERRKRFLDQLPPNTTVVIPGATNVLRNGDVHHAFRQESNFYYLTGFEEPDAIAILSNAIDQPKFTLIVPPRDPARETWDGKRAGSVGAVQKYRAEMAFDLPWTEYILKKTAQKGARMILMPSQTNAEANQKLAALLKRYQTPKQRVTETARTLKGNLHNLQAKVLRRPAQAERTPENILDEMRLIKTPYEIALLKRACDISAIGHMNAMRNLKLTKAQMRRQPVAEQGRNEGEVQAEVEYAFRKHGAVRTGYSSIAGGGANSCVLHYVTNREYAKPGDVELVDAGAEYGYYTADITRTWPINGRFSPAQRAIYNLVLKAQEAGIAMTRPGVSMKQVHDTCVRVITQGLMELGILKGDAKNPQAVDAAIKNGEYRKYFMHGTSHMLGMDVHDVPASSSSSNMRNQNIRDRALQPGMFFTVEPGVYIDPEMAKKEGLDPKWWGIGVRIEDDILVTTQGHENFSASIPRTTDAIEALMRQA